MNFPLLYLIIASFCSTLTLADIEYTNTESLHEEIPEHSINSLENQLCNSKSEDLWKLFETKIDSNNDSVITTNEIENYLWKRIKDLHQEELEIQINRIDPDGKQKIDFNSYIKDIFDTLDDLTILESPITNNDNKEMKQLYEIEKQTWLFLAKSLNESLSYDKFYELIFPDEFPKVKEFQVKVTFEVYDTNKDGFISVDEFLDYSKDVDESIVKISKNKFTKKIDLNLDNKLDFNEFKKWNKQTSSTLDQIISDEKNYLLNCCDDNQNGNFNKIEIEKNCESFLHSLITNYSMDLDKDRSNKSNFKDEL